MACVGYAAGLSMMPCHLPQARKRGARAAQANDLSSQEPSGAELTGLSTYHELPRSCSECPRSSLLVTDGLLKANMWNPKETLGVVRNHVLSSSILAHESQLHPHGTGGVEFTSMATWNPQVHRGININPASSSRIRMYLIVFCIVLRLRGAAGTGKPPPAEIGKKNPSRERGPRGASTCRGPVGGSRAP